MGEFMSKLQLGTNKFFLAFMLLITLNLSGCASSLKMGLIRGQDSVDVSNESIALLTVKISNINSPNCQQKLTDFIYVDAKIGSQYQRVSLEEPFKSEPKKYNEYLISLNLKPGTYKYLFVRANYYVPLVMDGWAELPLLIKGEIKPNSVVYLGHVDAVIRDRKDDSERRAGPLLPFLDQVCFSTGAFDIVVKDNYEEDMKAFLQEYPVLQKVHVTKSILPAGVRPGADDNLLDPTLVP
jgi:hypothetical protein